MDGSQFDALTRSLAERPSRRRVLAALGAGALALAGRATTSAKPHPKGCNDFCKALGLTGRDLGRCQNDCGQGATGLYTQCGGSPANFCNGVCVDTQTDEGNCGGCGQPCTNGECVGGTCTCFHDGQHVDETGTCTCDSTVCTTSADCCDNPYTGAFMCTAGQCTRCTPYTFIHSFDDPEPPPCCDGDFFSTDNFGTRVCLRRCTSNDDCLGVHTCQSNGYCGCPDGYLPGVNGASCGPA